MVKKGTYTWVLGFIFLLLVTACSADAETYDKQGREHVDEGEYGQAIEAFTKAIETDPEYADAYNNRGNTYRKNGDLDEALADLNKAVQLDPGHYKAYKNRAKLFAAQGELDQALADFNQSIELEPDYVQNYYDRALVHRNLENPRAAITDLELFLTLNDDDEWRERAEEKLKEFQGR